MIPLIHRKTIKTEIGLKMEVLLEIEIFDLYRTLGTFLYHPSSPKIRFVHTLFIKNHLKSLHCRNFQNVEIIKAL